MGQGLVWVLEFEIAGKSVFQGCLWLGKTVAIKSSLGSSFCCREQVRRVS